MAILQPPLLRALKITPNGAFGLPRPRRNGIHFGIDLQASTGDAVVAAAPGRVARTGFDEPPPAGGGGGNFVIVSSQLDGQAAEIGYMHLTEIRVAPGDELAAGDLVGTAGNSGAVESGTHLHFQVKKIDGSGGKTPVDPTALLAGLGGAKDATSPAALLSLLGALLVARRVFR